jgi:diguanylate cyclase (GGDEF)-like protein
MRIRKSPIIGSIIVAAAIASVGWIDYQTGTEVRVSALYFLSVILAAWLLGRPGAIIGTLCALATWLTLLQHSGPPFSSPLIFLTNAVTEGAGFMIVAVLVAYLFESIERERLYSRKDTLTDAVSRREFMALANTAVESTRRYARPCCVIYIDLNNFKRANDIFGHERGDELLQRCAEILIERVRATDTVSRLGGDEFAILLPETDMTQTSELIDRIQMAISEDPLFQLAEVSASIGAAETSTALVEVAQLLREADQKMYAEKHASKVAYSYINSQLKAARVVEATEELTPH